MALKEEFEYIAYRCCYCHYWNPARKQRPTAPKLEATRPHVSTESSSSEEGRLKYLLKFYESSCKLRVFLFKNRNLVFFKKIKKSNNPKNLISLKVIQKLIKKYLRSTSKMMMKKKKTKKIFNLLLLIFL